MTPETRSTRPTRLSRALIVDAALELTATPGVSDLTFRALGRELGVDHTAIYRHFPSKEALMGALADRLLERVGLLLPADPAAAWREWLHEGALAFHDVFLAHPALALNAMAQREVGAAELKLVDGIIAAISAAGLRGPSLLKHYGAYSSLVLSFTAMAAHEQLASADTVGEATWAPTSVPVTATSHPHLFPIWADFSTLSFRDTYVAGLTVILDAIEADARRGGA